MRRKATVVLASLLLLSPALFYQGKARAEGKGHGHGNQGDDEGEYRGQDDRGEGDGEAHYKGKGKEKKHGHKTVYKFQGGPPPWAPAHGYREQRRGGDDRDRDRDHGGPVVVQRPAVVVAPAATVYVAPFGIDAGRCDRRTVGTLLGGTLGGIAGSTIGKGQGRTAAIIGGTVLGALVGGSVGRAMDQVDQACVGQVLEHAPNDRAVQWQDPDGGTTYNTVPTGTYEDTAGRYCREYQTSAVVGGKRQTVYGTACRQPDGSWQIVK